MLILRKIIKILATRCQILKLKCTKFDFGWGSAPDPAGQAYSAPRLLSCDALLLRGGTEGRRGGEGRGREGSGMEGKEKKCVPPPLQSYIDHCLYAWQVAMAPIFVSVEGK